MNQPNAPAILTRPVPPVESPDLLYVLRKHTRLLIAGTLLGAGIATGLYFYLAKTQPRYESYVEFQVLPPPTPLGSGPDNARLARRSIPTTPASSSTGRCSTSCSRASLRKSSNPRSSRPILTSRMIRA